MNRTFLKISLLLVLVLESQGLYTIQEAQECFHSKGLGNCQNEINECLTREQCERELHFFHDCNFQKQQDDQIFNGNCFKNWNQTAVQSKGVIECFDRQCNLASYNSEVSLPVLYSCSSETLITLPIECDQKCQQVLSQKVSKKLMHQPIKQIYSQNALIKQQITDQNVTNIIRLIREQCIEKDAPIRKRHQNDLFNKKINKQKMMDRMNKRTKADSFLNQVTEEEKKVTSDL